MKTRKTSVIWLFVTLLVISAMLSACAQPAAPTEAEPTEVMELPTEESVADEDFSPEIPDPEEPVVVTFATPWHTGGENDLYEIMAARFHEIHPNITIEFQDVPFEEMHDKLLTQVGANNPPDAAYVDSPTVGEFAQRNVLVALDDYISKSTVIEIDDYVQPFKDVVIYNDKMYGLPIDGETTGLFYRTDRFEEAGLDPTKPPTTWEEFEEYAAKLTDPANKKYGFISFASEAAYYFFPWLWQAGGNILNQEDPNDVVFDSPEGQEAANFYINLVNYSSPDYLNSNSWDGRVAFANGDVAMYIAGSWFAGTLISEFPDANGLWNTAPLPNGSAGCATTIASDDLVVFAGSEHPEAAFKWIEFMSAPENMLALNVGSGDYINTLLPPRISLLEDPALYEGREFLKGFADNMACAHVDTVDQPNLWMVEEQLNEYLGRAFYGEMDGANAMIEAAKAAEAALAEAE